MKTANSFFRIFFSLILVSNALAFRSNPFFFPHELVSVTEGMLRVVGIVSVDTRRGALLCCNDKTQVVFEGGRFSDYCVTQIAQHSVTLCKNGKPITIRIVDGK